MKGKPAKTNGALRHPARALACDGDGKLTKRKILARKTALALDQWQTSGRKLILTTGETTAELQKFPDDHSTHSCRQSTVKTIRGSALR
jgi:hypothetical protein